MRTAAILPVKRFPAAKTRLHEAVGQPTRRALAAAMAEDVMVALSEIAAIEWTIVVTAEAQAAAPAERLGAIVIDDVQESGQSDAVRRGVDHALQLGAERVVCVPGDCPALEPDEIETLLRIGGDAACVVVVPDRHGTGTNALVLTPPDVMQPSFGPESCERHLRLAAEAGAAARLEHPPSLLLDVDTGADLEALRERLARDGGRARLTRAVLDGLIPTPPPTVRA